MTPTICAALAWHAEPLDFLERCVRSLAGVCDSIVALPGPWGHFPEIENDVNAEADVIAATAMHFGLGVIEIWPARSYESQVEKRSVLMQRAAHHGQWVLVVDGDCWIEECDPAAVRAELAATDKDVALLNVRTVYDPPRTTRGLRFLFRSSAGVTVENGHNGYRTADGRWLHGDPAYVRLEPAEEATARHILMLHDRNARGGARQAASREYRRIRTRLQLEDWRR